MPDSTDQLLLPITGALFVFALLLLLLSLRLFRRSRNDVFWRRRRQAGQRGWRVFVLAFVLFAASALTCGLTGLSMLVNDDDQSGSDGTPSASQLTSPAVPSLTPSSASEGINSPPVPTAAELSPASSEKTATGLENSSDATPPSTVTVVVTTAPAITPSPTVFPTFTPVVTPLYSTITPPPYAQLRITALDDRISDDLQPINPRQQFAAGTTRLYLFVEFRSMIAGVLWRRELLRDGVVIEENSYLWGLDSTGSSYFFFGDDNGFQPGTYEVRVYIGSSLEPASVMPFTVTG